LCVRVDVYKYVYMSRSPRCQPIQIVKVGGHLHVTITSPPPEPEVSVPPRAMIQSTQQAIHYTVPNQLSKTACAFLLLLLLLLYICYMYIFMYFDFLLRSRWHTHTQSHTQHHCKRDCPTTVDQDYAHMHIYTTFRIRIKYIQSF